MTVSNETCELYCRYKSKFNSSMCSNETFVYCMLGPRTMLEEGPLVSVAVLMSALAVIGVLGNTAVCVVIVKHPSMRTDTNRYLFSLAITDLLFPIFGVPTDIWRYYHAYPYTLGRIFCKMTTFLMDWTSYSSVLTVVTFSLERYFAICHPIRSQTIWKRPSAILILCIIWTVSMVCAVPHACQMDVFSNMIYPETGLPLKEAEQCNLPLEARNGEGEGMINCYFRVTTVVLFVIPMVVLLVVYIQIGITIRKRPSNIDMNTRSNARTSRGTIRLLIAVVVTFFICWAPFYFDRIYNAYSEDRLAARKAYIITGCFCYLSAVLNPILYSVISRKYRAAFKEILFGDRKLSRENETFMKEYTKNKTTNDTRITEQT